MELYMPMPMPAGPFVDYRRRNMVAPPVVAPRPELVKQGNQARYKTELCRAFQDKGVCKYGEKCQFAHGSNELRSLPRHPKYKTEMCRTFHSTGICPYGPRCHFIHNSEQEPGMRHYGPPDREMLQQPPPMPMPPPGMMLPYPPQMQMQMHPMYESYMRAEEMAYAHQYLPLIDQQEDMRAQYVMAPPSATPPMSEPAAPSVGPSVDASTTPSPPASVSTMSPPSGTTSARSPPETATEQATEAMANVRIASPPAEGSGSPPSSPAQSPRRLPVFSAFKK